MTYSQGQAAAVLRTFGFRIRTNGEFHQVIRTVQAGYHLGAWLSVDGQCGPKTSAAIARSRANGGKASAHFRWSEFRCTCGGRYSNCRRIIIVRKQLRGLEVYRTKVGHSVRVVSGYRCPGRNAEVDGASNSQHLYGTATDVDDGLSRAAVLGLHVFTGVGRGQVTGDVQHVDCRPGPLTEWEYKGQ